LIFTVFLPCGKEEGWKTFNGTCYKHFIETLTWFDARTRCETIHKGNLVILNTVEEEQFLITKVLPATYQIWIGIHDDDPGTPRVWRWIDGSVPSFERWGPNQPNLHSTQCATFLNGKYFQVNWNHDWNDRPCSALNGGFVCEKKQNQPD